MKIEPSYRSSAVAQGVTECLLSTSLGFHGKILNPKLLLKPCELNWSCFRLIRQLNYIQCIKSFNVQSAENVCFSVCVRKAIWSVMVVSVTCRRTLNPGWCLFWACVTAQSEALIDDTFLRSPSSHWIGRSLTNQAVQPGASQSGFLWTTTPAQRTSLLTSKPATDLQGQRRAPPRLSPMPNSVWLAWVWTSCKGGSEMETRGRCVHVWSVNLLRNWRKCCCCVIGFPN